MLIDFGMLVSTQILLYSVYHNVYVGKFLTIPTPLMHSICSCTRDSLKYNCHKQNFYMVHL